MHFKSYRLLLVLLLTVQQLTAQTRQLETFENCRLVATDWADGDSFLVRTADKQEFTVRLYGADCVEWHITDASDERRLRTQRRYFGISDAGSDVRSSIEVARSFGEAAAEYVRKKLAKPFTLHTAFADARGDGRHKRIYGFVITHDGHDMAADLIASGLARAFGVSRGTYDGRSQEEYRAYLADLELQAASAKKGIWGKTNWSTLPEERRMQRMEDAELAIALDTAPLAEGMTINPNTAARDELDRIPGLGEELANRIIENRPYTKPEDLLNVPGIGNAKLKKMLPFLDFSER